MRLLKRNCPKPVLLYRWTGEETDLNGGGLHTGEFYPEYDEPIELPRANVSSPSGHASQGMFGKDTRYTHVMLLDDVNAPITEHDKVEWNGITFSVTAVRPSLNVLSVALQRVTANHADGEGT